MSEVPTTTRAPKSATDLRITNEPGRYPAVRLERTNKGVPQSISIPDGMLIQSPNYPGLNITIGSNSVTGLPIVVISTDDVPEGSPMIGPEGQPYIEVVLGRDAVIYDCEPKFFAVTQSITYMIEADDEEGALSKLSEISETLPAGVVNVNMEAHVVEQTDPPARFPELAEDHISRSEVVA